MSKDTIQSTFTIPYTQVHNKVIDSTYFDKPIDKLVYISLLRFAFHKGHAFPSIKKLAEMNISSENTIRTSLKRLQEKGLVTKQERKEGNRQISNIYYLNDLPEENEENEQVNVPPQKLKGGTSKIEGGTLQKLKGGSSKIEDEEKELNKKNLNNNKYNNQSITEKDIENLDLPIAVQKQMILKKDRLIDDNINILEIELMYNAYKDMLNDFMFAQILGTVLESTKGRIRSIKQLMSKSIHNHLKQSEQAENKQPESNEVIPDWFRERKEQQKKETSYTTDYSKYDFSKRKNADWLEVFEDDPETLEAYRGLIIR